MSKKEQEIRRLAARIPNQAAFDELIGNAKPEMQNAVRAMLIPFLSFKLVDDTDTE